MTPPRRVSLGRDFSFSERVYVFLSAEAVEVEHVDGYEVTTRRVLLDEVQLVTQHRARRVGLSILLLLATLFFAWPILIIPKLGSSWVVFLALSAPFVIGLAVHLLLGTDYVTVFGRRSRARMAFNFRKGRARQVFDQLVREALAAQASRRVAPAAVEPASEATASSTG